METSAKRSSISPSIDRSYRRISGGTPIISVGNIGGGAKIKSKTESALERYEAERAVKLREAKDNWEDKYGPGSYAKLQKVAEQHWAMQRRNEPLPGSHSEYSIGRSQRQEERRASERAASTLRGYLSS